MSTHLTRRAGVLGLALALAACADGTSSTRPFAPGVISRSGSATDTTLSGGGGGGGGGGGTTAGGGTGGGTSSATASCGTLSNVSTYNITVYTTRTGIGIGGNATNCGTRKEAFEVDATDQNTDPSCTVSMPHFIAVRNTDPGLTTNWAVNSTLVPCQGQLHTFDIRLWDTKTGQTMATTTVSAFL